MERVRILIALIALFFSVTFASAQQTTAVGAVPNLINYSGVLKDGSGKVLTSITGVTFLIYSEQQGGAPVWMETQNVQPDARGNYTAQLGSTKPDGMPVDLFTTGEARWLALTVNGGEEQSRVLLVAVPYAMKAADAQTLGGLPASAFVLANKQATGGSAAPVSANNTAPPANPAVTGKGVVDFIPMWDSASDIVDSVMFQKSSQIGIGTTSPAATLDVNGKGDVRDTLTLFPKGTDPTLAISGTTFKVDQTGKMTFVSGQTFPGTGSGTITGVTAGTDLTGGGNGGKVRLNLDTTKVPLLAAANVFTNNQAIIGGPATWSLTVSQPNFNTILEQGPESGVGTALEMQTTGTGGMFWQILNTGVSSSQGANKLNFRNDSAGVDVMTLTASGQVGMGTTTPASVLDVFSATNPGGVIARFGSNGTTDSDSTKIYNGSAETETFLAGCAGCFVPGAQVGDGGVRVLPGKNLVFGDSGASRLILDSSGNASQPHAAGGMAKAMVFVNGVTPPYSILRCFNSALVGAAATTPPCGINLTETISGNWNLDFGFEIDDRFFSVEVAGGAVCHQTYPISSNTLEVDLFTCDGSSGMSADYYLLVY